MTEDMKDTRNVRSFPGNLRVMAKTRGLRRPVELWLLNEKLTGNNWRFTDIKEHMKLFVDTPLLVAYKDGTVGDGHNFDEVRDEDGNIIPSFMADTAERIVGYIKTESDLRIENRGGTEWIVAKGYIWEWYARELVDKLKEQGLEGMSISIETLVLQSHMEDGAEVITDYEILGTTILGDDVTPAVAGANIRALSEIGADAVRKITLKVAALNNTKTEEKSNPQKYNRKGEIKAMIKAKELQAKCPDYTVLAVKGENAVLLSGNGDLCCCSVKKENGEITVSEIVSADAVSVGCGESAVEIDFAKIAEETGARLTRAERDYEVEREARIAAEEKLEKMKKSEKARRVAAVKSAAEKRLEEINENRDEKIIREIIEDLLTDEKLAEYAEMEDKDGNFIGEAEICKGVDAHCMSEIIKQENTVRANSNRSYIWETNTGHKAVHSTNGVFAAAQRLSHKN